MQSTLRARPESQGSGPDTAVVATQASARRGWFSGLFRLGPKASPKDVIVPEANPLLAFPSETGPRPESVPIAEVRKRPAPAPRPSTPGRSKLLRSALIVAVIIALPSLGVLATRRFSILQFTAGEPKPGNLTIDTRPAGSDVLIDGARRGATPLTLALAPGAHTITIRSGADERVVPLTIAAGAERVAVTSDPKLVRFWENLRPGFDVFERARTLPRVAVEKDGSYRVDR